MSITNRHPIIHNIIKNRNNKKWVIVLFQNGTPNNIFDILKKNKLSIITSDINPDHRKQTYMNCDNILLKKICYFDKACILKETHNEKIFDGFVFEEKKSTKLNIIKEHLINKCSVVCINSNYFCEINNLLGISRAHTNNIFANIYDKELTPILFTNMINEVSSLDSNNSTTKHIINLYTNVSKKLSLDKFIFSDAMIIPHSKENYQFIDDAIQISKNIKTNDEDFLMNISLTLCNKLNNKICDIDTFIMEWNRSLPNNIFDSSKIEYIKSIHPNSMEKTKFVNIPKNYIYYPYLNVNAIPSHTTNKEHPLIFDTEGHNYENLSNPYPYMFKKYSNNYSGIFIKRPGTQVIVPKIIHHLWLEISPIKKYIDTWKKILNNAWEYNIWDNSRVENMMLNNRWNHFYKKETDPDIKKFIISIAILEKYGGVIVDAYTIPIKNIPDDILKKEFVASYKNEKYCGVRISYNIIASVAKPPECLLEEEYYSKKLCYAKNDSYKTCIHDQIYNLFCTRVNFFIALDSLIRLSNTIIFPSYYFNSDVCILPIKTHNETIFANIRDTINKEIYDNVEMTRPVIFDPNNIIASLKENPKNSIKNLI